MFQNILSQNILHMILSVYDLCDCIQVNRVAFTLSILSLIGLGIFELLYTDYDF